MKHTYIFLFFLLATRVFSQASYTSAGTGNWNAPATWTLSSGTDSDADGIPDADDNVTIAASHTITVNVNSSCLAFTMANATSTVAVNGGITLNVTGAFSATRGSFTGTSGALNLSGASVVFGNTTGGPSVGPSVTVNTLSITSQRTTYSSSVTITKLAAAVSVDSWRGGNTFNGTFTLTNAAGDPTDPNGDIYIGSNAGDPTDVFNGRANFYLTGAARIRIPQSGSATFNGVTFFYSQGFGTNHDRIQPARLSPSVVTFNDSAYFYCSSSTTDMHIAYDAGTTAVFNGPVVASHAGTSAAAFNFGIDGTLQFKQNIILSNLGSGSITFTTGTGSSTLFAGKQIIIGSSGFSSGGLDIQRFTQVGTTAQTLVLTGTASLRVGNTGNGCSFGGNVNFTAPSISLVESTYSGTAAFTKTGTAASNCGGNTFSNTFSAINTGSGAWAFSQITAGDIFNNTVSITNSGTGPVQMSRTFATNYTQNITLNSTSTGTISFGANGGSSTLASGRVFTIGGLGFATGTLTMRAVSTNTFQSLTLGTAATFNVGQTAGGNTFGNGINFSAGSIPVVNNTITGNANITKTGAGTDDCGGNTFNNAFNLTNNGTGGIRFSQAVAADIFNSTVTINNSSSGGITMSRTFNTLYPDNIQISNTGSGGIFFGFAGGASTLSSGKTISNSSFSTATLELREFTQLGTTAQNLNFSGTGGVRFGNGNNSSCYFNGDLTINTASGGAFTADTSFFYGTVNISAGSITTFDSEYNGTSGTSTLTKTGATNDVCGRNIFNGLSSITNQGSGSIQFGQTNAGDIFQNDLSITNGGAAGIAMSRTFASTYNGNVTVASYAAGGVSFGANNGASTMAATKSINTGGSGFSSGTLTINKFTQNGSATNTLTMTGSANLSIGTTTNPSDFGGDVIITNNSNTTCNSSTFRRNFTMSTNGMQIESCNFNSTSGSTTFTKSQNNSADNNGGNTFNGPFTLNQNGGVRVWMGQTIGADNFIGTVTLNASSSFYIEMARTQGSTFQNTISLNSTSNGGITFGNNGGVSNQSANMSISTGTFNNGTLDIRKFNQAAGTQTNTLTLTGGSTNIYIGTTTTNGCDFGGIMNISSGNIASYTGNQFRKDFTSTSSSITIASNTFNATSGTTSITKTGTSNDDANGGNVFNGTATLTVNAGSGRWRLASNLADDYNGNLSLVQSQVTGLLQPSYNTNCTYSGNISLTTPNTSTVMTFGSGGAAGITTIDGANAQTFSITAGSALPLVTRMVMSKSANSLTLNTRVNIGNALTMTQGLINTTSTNIINMNDASTTTVGNASSYINGPMNYDMAVNNTTRTLNMPIGKGADWRPVALTVRHSAATSFTYNSEVFNASAVALAWSLPATVDTVSSVHYWDINRYTTGTTTSVPSTSLSYSAGVYPLVQLYFGTNDYVYDGTNLTIVKNTSAAPTTWFDIGGTSSIGVNATPVAGSVTSTSTPSAFNSFSRFTLGSKLSGLNPLPVDFVSFDANKKNETVELKWVTAREENSNYFSIERSVNGIDFVSIGQQEAAHQSNSYRTYEFVDVRPVEGINYYRIKEFDYNNHTTVTTIKSVVFTESSYVQVFPNPVNDILYFESNKEEVNNVIIYSAQGAKVKEFSFIQRAELPIQSLGIEAGVYFIHVESDGSIYHLPIIITQ